MSRTLDRPQLTPRFCFNQTQLRDFLRTSRSAVDDTILQNLNALVAPAANAFDPNSTTVRQSRTSGQRQINSGACQEFKQRVLFPAWNVRTEILDYCAGVATSPDPDDPDHVLREHEDARSRERLIDERLDPYGARYLPTQGRTEALAGLIRNERMVENIIRARSWSLCGERCDNEGVGAEQALDDWRRRRATEEPKDSSLQLHRGPAKKAVAAGENV